jgi:hypothetical protein
VQAAAIQTVIMVYLHHDMSQLKLKPCPVTKLYLMLYCQKTRTLHLNVVPLNARYSLAFLSRSALVITDTELKLMAAAAMIGLSRIPNLGYSTPAAIGTPTEL